VNLFRNEIIEELFIHFFVEKNASERFSTMNLALFSCFFRLFERLN